MSFKNSVKYELIFISIYFFNVKILNIIVCEIIFIYLLLSEKLYNVYLTEQYLWLKTLTSAILLTGRQRQLQEHHYLIFLN